MIRQIVSSFSLLPVALAALSLTSMAVAQSADNDKGPKNLMSRNSDFEKSNPTENPWGGVASSRKLKTFGDVGMVVLDTGKIRENQQLSTGIRIVDLTGDKIPDVIASDPKGYIWLYPNSGTQDKPKFTHGEIATLWFTSRVRRHNRWRDFPSALKIEVADFTEDGVKDFVIGNFLGEVHYLENRGTASAPRFEQGPRDEATPTKDGGQLWANFFAPALHDVNGDQKLDLIVGEGGYSANNIWWLPNEGSNQNPRFSHQTRQVLIRGFGNEHLTPAIVDWNGDGKFDVITGCRSGEILVYVNDSKPDDKRPWEERWVTHDTGKPIGLQGVSLKDSKDLQITGNAVKFGSRKRVGTLSTASAGDLNGDGLFDLFVANTSGYIYYAENKGKKGEPKFTGYRELRGENPYPKYRRPSDWSLVASEAATYVILETVTNDQSDSVGYRADFEPSNSDPKNKSAALVRYFPPDQKFFKGKIPVTGTAVSPTGLTYNKTISLKPKTKYEITFDCKGKGWTNSGMYFFARETWEVDGKRTWKEYRLSESFTFSGGWSTEKVVFSYRKDRDTPENREDLAIDFRISWHLEGEGEFYIDNVSMLEK